MNILNIFKKALKPKHLRRKLRKQVYHKEEDVFPVANPTTNVVPDASFTKISTKPQNAIQESDKKPVRRTSYVEQFANHLEQVHIRRASEIGSISVSGSQSEGVASIKSASPGSLSQRKVHFSDCDCLEQTKENESVLASDAFFVGPPASQKENAEQEFQTHPTQSDHLDSPNWVPLPPSSPFDSRITEEGSTALHNSLSPFILDEVRPFTTVRAVSPYSLSDESCSGGCPLSSKRYSPRSEQHQSMENTSTISPISSADNPSGIPTVPAPDRGSDGTKQEQQQTSKPLTNNDQHGTDACVPNETNVIRNTHPARPILPNHSMANPINIGNYPSLQYSNSLTIVHPKPTVGPLRSKKEGLAARLQTQVDHVMNELGQARAENLRLTEVIEDLNTTMATNLEYIISQQRELANAQLQLAQASDFIDKLRAYNKELEQQTLKMSGRIYTTEYRWGITRMMLQECHDALEQTRAAQYVY